MIVAARAWGSTPAERELEYGCDRVLSDPHDTVYRGIDVNAPTHLVFRWLCQLKVAPYSYDWIDNGGRTSPRRLIPGLDELAIGQRFMTVFELADFEPGHQLTLCVSRPGFLRGLVAVTYAVLPGREGSSRIAVKMLIRYPGLTSTVRRLVPAVGTAILVGDLVMMRRQLMNLRDLAERQMAGATR